MPASNLTLAQLKDQLGDIVIFNGVDAATKKPISLTVDQLPVAAIAFVVAWLNQRLST